MENIMAKKSKVDPDTGYTPEEQQEKFKEIFSAKKQSKQKPQIKRKVHRNPMVEAKSEADLKAKAVALYEGGKGPKEVSKELSISYASAYYYKRFAGSSVKKERLKKSMERV